LISSDNVVLAKFRVDDFMKCVVAAVNQSMTSEEDTGSGK